jgi:hypothetical protein
MNDARRLMSRHSRTDAAFLLATLAAVIPFALQLAGRPGGAAGDEARLYAGNLSKLFFVALAALGAIGSAARFEADNPMRGTWRMMAAGLLTFTAGQAALGVYQAVLRLPSPFPSIADAFFVASYPFFLAALLRAIRAYGQTGYPIGTARERVGTAAATAAVAVVVGYPALRPVVATPAPPLELLLNVAYPVLDLAVLVPVAILLRIAVRFRGGEVWKVWAGLLAGFLLMCVGDILFAYFTAMERESLDPLIHVTYILSYAALARGAVGQYQLLK